jgi:hypothetical protein
MKGQSIVEYVILLAVIIAAVLIMQVFIKRGYSGRLKGAADDMGDMFSASNTSWNQSTTMTGTQYITSEIGTTNAGLGQIKTTGLQEVGDRDIYSYTNRTGGNTTMYVNVTTDSARDEQFRW